MPGVVLSALREPTYSFLTARLRSGCGYYPHFTDKETETREAKSFTQGQRKSLPSLPHCDPMNGEGEFGSSYTHWHLTPAPPARLSAAPWKLWAGKQWCWRGAAGKARELPSLRPADAKPRCEGPGGEWGTGSTCPGVGWGSQGFRGDAAAPPLPEVGWGSRSLAWQKQVLACSPKAPTGTSQCPLQLEQRQSVYSWVPPGPGSTDPIPAPTPSGRGSRQQG